MINTEKGKFQKGRTPWNKNKKFKLDDTIINLIVIDYKKGLNIFECAEKYKLSEYKIYMTLKDLDILRPVGSKTKSMTAETKNKISKANKGHSVPESTRKAVSESNKKRTKEQLKIQVSKSYLTKKKNNSFNKSKDEEILYEKLLKENVNKTIYRQYKDENRYPYYCDFYIVEDDLFIEVNAHWTHGGHPFNKNDQKDIEKLNEWKEKAKTSKFYQQAIYVWTELDVKKQKCAKENNLNYKVIY